MSRTMTPKSPVGRETEASPGERAYGLGLLAAAVALAVLLGGADDAFRSAREAPMTIVLWIAMGIVAARSPIPAFGRERPLTLLPALDAGAILIFGPATACWIATIVLVSGGLRSRGRELVERARGAGGHVLAVGVSGLAFVAMGGPVGFDLAVGRVNLPALVAAGLAYLALHALLALAEATIVPAPGRERTWLETVECAVTPRAVVLPFGVLLALIQIRIGALGVGLFLVPVFLARHVFALWARARESHLEAVRVLMDAIDAAEPHTRGHSYRIAKMSVRVGRHLGLAERELEELEYAALLHDLGRTAIRREILGKRGPLTEEERTILRKHPRIGAEMVERFGFFPRAPEIVRTHHERPDGEGYPRGLTAEEIPVGSRILMAVSAFDAMTSDRPYRRGLAPEEALDELRAHSRTQFFPEVVGAIIHLYRQNLLFEEFDDGVLATYASGDGNSRAVRECMRRLSGFGAGEPSGFGADESDDRDVAALGVPVVELPAQALRPTPGTELASPPPGAAEDESEELAGMGAIGLDSAARTDVGCARKNNEDAFAVIEGEETAQGRLLVVADGMGGAAAGEVASRLAVEEMRRAFGRIGNAGDPSAWMRAAIENANRRVYGEGARDERRQGMGTTCTSLWLGPGRAVVGHVGDSRAYRIRGGALEALTRDHTVAEELSGLGGGGAQAAAGGNHVLTRSLGAAPAVRVDVRDLAGGARPGDAYLLCSDGVTAVVSDEELAEIVSGESPAEACETVVELARARGAPDNVTLIVAKLQAEE